MGKVRLERVDPHVERRALGQGGGLLGAALAEGAGHRRLQPVRVVAPHRRRRPRKVGRGGQAAIFRLSEGARSVCIRGRRRQALEGPFPEMPDRAEHGRPIALRIHHPGKRTAVAKDVQDQPSNEGAILGPGVTRALAPRLQRQLCRAMARGDIAQHLDRRRQAAAIPQTALG